jgi:glycosyltransferase involved in cell wall biosynthesis
MATLNGAQFIEEQLASLASQTHRPDEIVISDDGSTDDTLQIIRRFSEKAPFEISLNCNATRIGLHRNFEHALSMARGDIVLLSDQDDVWYPNKIQALLATFEKNPSIQVVHHDEDIFDQATGRMLDGTLAERTRRLGGWDSILAAGNCTALRREMLSVLLPFPEGFFYDAWINWLPEILGTRLVLLEPLQLWRRHGSNESLPAVAEDRASILKLYRRFGFRDPRAGWEERRRQVSIIRQRISERSHNIDNLIGANRASLALERVKKEIDRIDVRLSLMRLPRAWRVRRVMQLWNAGFYDNFSGWKSALKDTVIQ